MSFAQVRSRIAHAAAIAGTALALFGTPAAHANLIPLGFAAGSQTFSLSTGQSVQAGAFTGTFNGNSIVFWCAELEQNFSFGGNYTYTSSLPNNGTFTALGQLFAAAFGGALTDATHSAAFQLAIWEVIYDSDRNLSGAGGFRVTGGNSATVALAQSWLNSMSNYADTYDIYLLSNGQHQNFITTRVPEPVSLLLFGTALLAMVLVTRRRGFAPIAR